MIAYLALALFAPLLSFAQDTQHTNATAFPACAHTCIASGIKAQPSCWSTHHACATALCKGDVYDYECLVKNGCGYTDDACVCTDLVFADAVANCTSTACDAAGRDETAKTANSQCAEVPGHLDFSSEDGTMEVSPKPTGTETTLPSAASNASGPEPPTVSGPATASAGKLKMFAGFMFGSIIGVVSALVLL